MGAWRAAEEAERSPWSWGKGTKARGWERRRAGSGRLFGGDLPAGLKGGEVCQAGRVGTTHREGTARVNARGPPASGTSRGPASRVLGRPGAGGGKRGALARKGLWSPLHEAASRERDENTALAPELPGVARQLCPSPASLCAAPFCPLSLSLPFCERRKLAGCLQIGLRDSEIPAGPAGAPETMAAVTCTGCQRPS